VILLKKQKSLPGNPKRVGGVRRKIPESEDLANEREEYAKASRSTVTLKKEWKIRGGERTWKGKVKIKCPEREHCWATKRETENSEAQRLQGENLLRGKIEDVDKR